MNMPHSINVANAVHTVTIEWKYYIVVILDAKNAFNSSNRTSIALTQHIVVAMLGRRLTDYVISICDQLF